MKTNIAHLFTGWYINPQGAPEMIEEANRRATLTYIDAALEEGLDISFDVIPQSLPTMFAGWQYMCALFVPWLRELGTRENFAKWVSVPDFREEVKDAIRRGKWFIRVAYNPDRIVSILDLYSVCSRCLDIQHAGVCELTRNDLFKIGVGLSVRGRITA